MDKRARIIQEGTWVARNIHGALQRDSDIVHAVNTLTDARLPLHPDRAKNWDHLLALWAAISTGGRDEPVLDAGACEDSAFLPALAECGYTSLTGCNIDQVPDVVKHTPGGDVRYQYGDVCATPFPTHTFRFVFCQSVIEHGVEWRAFFTEMSRIIKPGGILFVSTDYWSELINAGGQSAFGAPVHVFSQGEIEHMLAHIPLNTMLTAETAMLDTCERPVKWLGMEYTFVNLVLRRR
jgi:SAM-dependent methyltransferase